MISGIWRKTADRREQNIVQRKPPERVTKKFGGKVKLTRG
jgi:hypothetical protein